MAVKLATDGQLNPLTDHFVMAAISQIASYRDEWQIADPQPLGPPPPADTDHFRDWSRIVTMIGATPTERPTPALDGMRGR